MLPHATYIQRLEKKKIIQINSNAKVTVAYKAT